MKKIFNYFLLLILLSCSNNNDKENKYLPVENWPKIPSNYKLGNPTTPHAHFKGPPDELS